MRPGAELRVATDIGEYARRFFWPLLSHARLPLACNCAGGLAGTPVRLAFDAL